MATDNTGKHQTMDVAEACEVFICGLLGVAGAHNRSERRAAGPLTVVHFDYDWHTAQRVADEFIVRDHEPATVLAAIAAYVPTADHTVTLIGRPLTDQQAYEQAGYRLAVTEQLMIRALADLPTTDARYSVTLARTPEHMHEFNERDPAGYAWITAAHLNEPRLRHYVIILDDQPVARARAFHCDAMCSYTSHVYTAEAYRRRGLAQAVMAQLLADAAAQGQHWNVLVASEQGASLYCPLGYTQLATVLVFKPSIPEEKRG